MQVSDALSIVEVDYCACGVVWESRSTGPMVSRILVSADRSELIAKYGAAGQSARQPPAIRLLCRSIARALNGQRVDFDLDILDLDICTAFQIKVLEAARRIPFGRVVAYGDIARGIGEARAARAVGNALARNPFPVIYPCHRVVTASGLLGGYIAGSDIKAGILRRERPSQADESEKCCGRDLILCI